MKTKKFFTILIGLVMTINAIQAQMYVIGTIDRIGSITFMIDYRGADDVNDLEILMDSTGGNNWTCIQKMPPYITAYTMINSIPNSSYLFVAGKDTSNILHYTTQQKFTLTLGWENNELKIEKQEIVSDNIKENFLIKSEYDVMGYALLNESGDTIVSVNNAEILDEKLKRLNEATSFEKKLDDIYYIKMFVGGLRNIEFDVPLLVDGNYRIEIYSETCPRIYTKQFQIKRN
jgi:hypothetical protein